MGLVFAGPWANTADLLDRYLDPTFNFNAAEAMYALIPSLSWTYQAVGDPKPSIVLTSASAVPQRVADGTMTAYPNPSNGLFILRSKDRITLERVTDVLGRTIPTIPSAASDRITLDLSYQAEGVHVIHCSSPRSGERFSTRVIVQR